MHYFCCSSSVFTFFQSSNVYGVLGGDVGDVGWGVGFSPKYWYVQSAEKHLQSK